MSENKTLFEKVDLKTLLIAGLMIALFLTNVFSNCSGDKNKGDITLDGKKYEIVKHTIDTVTVNKDTTIYKPGKTIYKDRTIYVKIPVIVDSALVVKEYYAENVYKDSLLLGNDLGQVYITDTISQNKIKGRKFEAKLKQTTIQDKTIVKELPKSQLYVGGVAGFDKKNLVNFVGPSLIFKSKTDKLYALSVGYGLGGEFVVQGGLFWKIVLHR